MFPLAGQTAGPNPIIASQSFYNFRSNESFHNDPRRSRNSSFGGYYPQLYSFTTQGTTTLPSLPWIPKNRPKLGKKIVFPARKYYLQGIINYRLFIKSSLGVRSPFLIFTKSFISFVYIFMALSLSSFC